MKSHNIPVDWEVKKTTHFRTILNKMPYLSSGYNNNNNNNKIIKNKNKKILTELSWHAPIIWSTEMSIFQPVLWEDA